MGICFLRSVPGLVVDLPRPLYFIRVGFSNLSIVDADMCHVMLLVHTAVGCHTLFHKMATREAG